MEFEDKYQQIAEPQYECLIFDVDDTLYPYSSGISVQIYKNIIEFMIKKLGVEESIAPEMCYKLYKSYGTAMAGLRASGYDFDYDEYHSFVHGSLPYEVLKPDPVLRNILLTLPIRKIIFSNGDEAHVAEVLNRLDLEGCFDDVICFETLNPTCNSSGSENENFNAECPKTPVLCKLSEKVNQQAIKIAQPNPQNAVNPTHNSSGYENENADAECLKTPVICKPSEEAYKLAIKIAQVKPEKALFFDDSIRNIQTGKRLGLHTVWVGSAHREEGVDYALESIHNLREALPELWEAAQKSGVLLSGKTAVETTVKA